MHTKKSFFTIGLNKTSRDFSLLSSRLVFKNPNSVTSEFLADKYDEKMTLQKVNDMIVENEVKIKYTERSQQYVRHENWQKEKKERFARNDEIRERVKKNDMLRFDRDAETLKNQKFGTIVIHNRGVIARKMILASLRKGYRVVCLYTESDKGSDYLNPETYKTYLMDCAKKLGLDPSRYQDAYLKRFKAVEVPSFSIKYKGKSVERNAKGNVDVKSTRAENKFADEILKVYDQIINDSNNGVQGSAAFPGYGYDAENPDLPALLDAYSRLTDGRLADRKYQVHFIGPSEKSMLDMGAKDSALKLAKESGVNVAPNTESFKVIREKDGNKIPQEIEQKDKLMDQIMRLYNDGCKKIQLKCTNGGGGRGQATIDTTKYQDDEKLKRAVSKALDKIAVEATEGDFGGDAKIFAEKFIENARHVEAQVIKDLLGNVKVLGLRDCSIQFNKQKFAERTVTKEMLGIDKQKNWIYDKIIKQCMHFLNKIDYNSAGTIEFLVDEDGENYFMEMNTRVQVEHEVTELETDDRLTGDIIDVAQGKPIWQKKVDREPKSVVVQARINAQEFVIKKYENDKEEIVTEPTSGMLQDMVLPQGEGITVRKGIEVGSRQTTLTDSMCGIIMAEGYNEEDATRRLLEALKKTRIVGFKTNLPVLRKYFGYRLKELETARTENRQLEVETVDWFDKNVRMFAEARDRIDEPTEVEKLAKYIGYVSVNGAEAKVPLDHKLRKKSEEEIDTRAYELPEEVREVLDKAIANKVRREIKFCSDEDIKTADEYIPSLDKNKLDEIINAFVEGKKSMNEIFDEYGVDKFMWEIVPRMRELNINLFTDTTTRDGHQSNFGTRMRNVDALYIQSLLDGQNFFSMEVHGGAMPDVNLQFNAEDPLANVEKIAGLLKNTPTQILWRGLNTVGYGPSNEFIAELFLYMFAAAGIKVFRIFDSQNDLDSMLSSIKAVRKMGLVAEGTVCYAGGLNDSTQEEYKVDYYVDLAKKLVAAGAHCICIKDMAGLMTPGEAATLFEALKKEVNVPIVFHTHDTLKTGVSSAIRAIKKGVNVVDVSNGAIAGGLAQPKFEEVLYELATYEAEESNTKLHLIFRKTAEIMKLMEQEINQIRSEVFSKYNNGFGDSEEEKEMYRKRLETLCKSLQAKRIELVSLKKVYKDELTIDQKYIDLFDKLEKPLEDIRKNYAPWDSNVDIETHVIESYIPGGMVSNYDDQIKTMHLEHLRREIIDVYVINRKLWGNPILVTPSSKYVGDQAGYCVECIIRDSNEEEFIKLVNRIKTKGINNISAEDISDLFGDGNSFKETTLNFFAGILGKHSNPNGIHPAFKELVDRCIDKEEKKGKVKRYSQPVAYYQNVTTAKEFTDSLDKLYSYEQEKPAIDLFIHYLNENYDLEIKSVSDLTKHIDRVSEERFEEIKKLETEKYKGDLVGWHEDAIAKVATFLNFFEDDEIPCDDQIPDIIRPIIDKLIVEAGKKDDKITDYQSFITADENVSKIKTEVENYEKSLKKYLDDYKTMNQKKISASQVMEAFNFASNGDISQIQDVIREKYADILDGKNRDIEGIRKAIHHFCYSSALGKGYSTYQSLREDYGSLCQELPTNVFTYGLSKNETILVRVDNNNIEEDLNTIRQYRNSIEVELSEKIKNGDSKKAEQLKKMIEQLKNTEDELREKLENGDKLQEEVSIKLLEISDKYHDHFKRKVKLEINNRIVIVEVVDEKEKLRVSKNFRKAEKEPYGPDKNQVDVGCPLAGMMMADIVKPGDSVKEKDVLGYVNAAKIANVIEAPDKFPMYQVVEVLGTERDQPVAGNCLYVLRGGYSDADFKEAQNFPYEADGEMEAISSKDENLVSVQLNATSRLKTFKKGESLGDWILKDGTKKPIVLPYNCIVDFVYGNKTTDEQKIKKGMVAMKVKELKQD